MLASACLAPTAHGAPAGVCDDALEQLEAARASEQALDLAGAERRYAVVAACASTMPEGAEAAARSAHLRERSDAAYEPLRAMRRLQDGPSEAARRELAALVVALPPSSLVKWEAYELLAGEDERAGRSAEAWRWRHEIVRASEAPAPLRAAAAALAVDEALAQRDLTRAELVLADACDVASATTKLRVTRARGARRLTAAAGVVVATFAAGGFALARRGRDRRAPRPWSASVRLALLPLALAGWLALGALTMAHLYGTPLPTGAYLRMCGAIALSGWGVRLVMRHAPRVGARGRATAALAAALFTAAAAWLAWQSDPDGFDAWVRA